MEQLSGTGCFRTSEPPNKSRHVNITGFRPYNRSNMNTMYQNEAAKYSIGNNEVADRSQNKSNE